MIFKLCRVISLFLLMFFIPFSEISATEVKVNIPVTITIINPSISLVYLSVLTNTVRIGDNFSVNIKTTPITEISGAQASLKFNGLKVNSIEEGNLFKQNNNQTFFYTGNITSDLVSNIACVIIGTGTSVNSDGILATINFTALTSGKVDLILENVILGDANAQKVDSQVINSSLNIYP